MTIKLIIGLKNPGSAYEHTRHNAGAWFVTALGHEYHCPFKTDSSLQTEMTSLTLQGHTARMMLPLTFMNHSGRPAQLVAQFYRVLPQEILVIHDELDLPPGRIKLKTGGGHGGHNGLRDIINKLGSSDFHRLRVGIGHPGASHLVHDYVLGKPTAEDRQFIFDAITRSIKAFPILIGGNMPAAMNIINS